MGYETSIDGVWPPLSTDNQVTASQLVRSFGIWQERAGREPVFIRHRGRAKLVLASVEQLRTLRDRAGGEASSPPLDQLLEGFTVPMLALDQNGQVLASNLAARPLLAARPPWLDHVWLAARSVGIHGIAEHLMLRAGDDEPTIFDITIRPWIGHVLVRIDNASLAQQLKDRSDAMEALGTAIDRLAPDAVRAVVTPRGYLAQPLPSLVALTGIAAEALAGTRFVTLVDIADRVEMGERIDRLFRDGEPARLNVRLRINRADPAPVAIAMTPVHEAAAIAAVQLVIVRRAP